MHQASKNAKGNVSYTVVQQYFMLENVHVCKLRAKNFPTNGQYTKSFHKTTHEGDREPWMTSKKFAHLRLPCIQGNWEADVGGEPHNAHDRYVVKPLSLL